MDIEDLKQMKKQAGLTNQEIADLSGIPVSTVNKIFSGATKNPRYASLLAIEQVLAKKEKIPFYYDDICILQGNMTAKISNGFPSGRGRS